MSGFTNQGMQNPDLWGLLNLMADPERYKEKLTEVSEVEKRLEAKIALAGHAEQILALRETAIQNHETAIEKLTAAENRAVEITQAAQERAQANLDTANAKAEESMQIAQKCLEDGRSEANAIITQASIKADAQRAILEQLQNEVQEKEVTADERLKNNESMALINEEDLAKNRAEAERLALIRSQFEQDLRELFEKKNKHQEEFTIRLEAHSQANDRYNAYLDDLIQTSERCIANLKANNEQ